MRCEAGRRTGTYMDSGWVEGWIVGEGKIDEWIDNIDAWEDGWKDRCVGK